MDEQTTPTVPPVVRTWAYIIGTLSGALAVAFDGTPAKVLAAVATGCLALALAYRPTKG